MSLRKKIIAAWVLCICFVFIPFVYIIQTKLKPINLTQVESQTLQLINSKANEIGSWLNQKISEINLIKEFPAFQTMNSDEIKPYITAINDASNSTTTNSNESFIVGDIHGKAWINDDLTIDISEKCYFKRAMASDKPYIISEPIISDVSEQPSFVICYPIISSTNEKIGFINGAVDLDIFSKITDDIDLYNGFSWIMNKNAEVYTSSTKNFDTLNLCTKERKLIVEETKKAASGVIDLKPLLNKDSLVFYSSVPYADNWILCTVIETKNIQAQTNEFIKIIFNAISLLLIASIIIAIIISGSITKSLKRLKCNMIEVSHGNLNSYYKTSTNDEISIIGKVFNTMLMDIKNLISEKDNAHELKRSAELKALQSQINPHFLYNTLDTIQWKALSHQAYDVVEMIQLLSKLFRLSLNNGNEFITIQEELEHVETYLKIQKIRYNQKINYTINCNLSKDKVCYIPKLIIQPLVENSIYHGLKPKKNKGHIALTVESIDNYIVIEVYDNGIGIPKDTLENLMVNLKNSIKSDHYGLYNVNERLKLTFGEECEIIIKSEFNIETTIHIKIPFMEENTLDKITDS